jgi:hypothetical protein
MYVGMPEGSDSNVKLGSFANFWWQPYVIQRIDIHTGTFNHCNCFDSMHMYEHAPCLEVVGACIHTLIPENIHVMFQ